MSDFLMSDFLQDGKDDEFAIALKLNIFKFQNPGLSSFTFKLMHHPKQNKVAN